MGSTNLGSHSKDGANNDAQSASKRTLMNEKVVRKRNRFKSSVEKEGEMQFLKSHYKHVKIKPTFRPEKDIKKKKHRSRHTKMKAFDMSTLSESLPDINSSLLKKKSTMTPSRSRKNRSKTADILRMQLGEILQNQYFQSDPLGSIHEHLIQTQLKENSENKHKHKHKNEHRHKHKHEQKHKHEHKKKNDLKTDAMSSMDTS